MEERTPTDATHVIRDVKSLAVCGSTCRGFSVTEVTTRLTMLAVSLVRLFNEVGHERGIARGWATYDLLIGAGALADAEGPGTRGWITPAPAANVGLLDDQLVTNMAGYTSPRHSDSSAGTARTCKTRGSRSVGASLRGECAAD